MTQTIQKYIETLQAADEQLEKLLTNRLLFQPQFKIKFDFITIISKDLKYLYVSEMGARSLGLKPIDMIGNNWREFNINLHSEHYEQLDKKIIEVLNTGTVIKHEYVFYAPNVQERYYFEYLISPFFASNGDIEAVMCNVTDITEKKLSDLALSNQIAKFNQLVNLCPIAIWLVDAHEQVVTANQYFANDVSLNQADIIGKPYRVIAEHLGIEYEESVTVKALNGIETRQEYVSCRGKKVLRGALPIRDQQTNDILGAIGIGTDISIQQELLNQYLNENKKLTQLIDSCPFAIAFYDENGTISALNKTGYEYYKHCVPNYKEKSFIGRSVQHLLAELGVDWVTSASYRALKGIETWNYSLKKSYGTYLINAVPLRNCENIIIGAITIFLDITEYEELREELTKLDHLNLVGEMAAGVAHEIRNPMTVVKGYLQFLSKKVSNNMVEQFRTALDELERVEQIITDFLSLAKNKLSDYKEQDLNVIVREITPLIRTDAIKRGIDLEMNLTEEMPALLLNGNEIKQLLLNLTRNGMEAMGQHGTLTIETNVKGDMVYLCVSDCGCGICKQHQDKIFDPFFTTKSNGTGLGLAVCAGIVRRHNGTIAVQSVEGQGTQFVVSFKQ